MTSTCKPANSRMMNGGKSSTLVQATCCMALKVGDESLNGFHSFGSHSTTTNLLLTTASVVGSKAFFSMLVRELLLHGETNSENPLLATASAMKNT